MIEDRDSSDRSGGEAPDRIGQADGTGGVEPSLVVFSDDWGRHPSSCQHLIGQLLGRYDVVWMNTIGTRPPRLDRLTLQRGLGKLSGWMSVRDPGAADPGSRASDPVPEVVSPLMWPRFTTPSERRLNARLLGRSLEKAVDHAAPAIGVTTIPLVADLVGHPSIDRWVYYCVDDLARWPGLDRDTLLEMEEALVERVDDIVVVSETLAARMAELGRESTLLTHGVDLEHWRPTVGEVPQDRSDSPLILFWGVIDRRLEVDWLRGLCSRMSGARVVLVGPRNNPDPALLELEGLEIREPVPYADLPVLAKQAEVLIMPYADLPATRAMQPLKLKEYLATDRPVVVSNLPAVQAWADACDVVTDGLRFAERVEQRVAGGLPGEQVDARARLERESWSAKAIEFERVLRGGSPSA